MLSSSCSTPAPTLTAIDLAAYVLLENRLAAEGEAAAQLFTDLANHAAWQENALPEFAAWLAQQQAQGYWVTLALSYELGEDLESKVKQHATPPATAQMAAPHIRAWAFRQRVALTADEVDAFLGGSNTSSRGTASPAGIADITPRLSPAAYTQAIQRVQAYIAAGDCYQVNFTFPLDFAWYGSSLALYAALRQQQPVAYGGFWHLPDYTALSFSPELFVTAQVITPERWELCVKPMKGTAPRHPDPVQDAALRNALPVCPKNQAENVMIVDLLRNDLGRIATVGSVQVSQLLAVETYPSVHQMVSEVRAHTPPLAFTEVLRALFPCGSITGAPKVRAMQIIKELEIAPRGMYTGSLGYLAPTGEFTLNVAIRSLELDLAQQRGVMGVGSGVVADSVAHNEWQECLLKSRFLQRHDPGFVLIETLRLELKQQHAEIALLPWHTQRIQDSAQALGFVFNETIWQEQIAAAQLAAMQQSQAEKDDKKGDKPGIATWRLRLTLNHAGTLAWQIFPLLPELPEQTPANAARYLRLAAQRVLSTSPLQRHKTSHRPLYDAALREIANTPEIFDVLFLNERDEVVEGARSAIFAKIQGQWFTPALSSGCLPSVWRARALAQGEAHEAVLSLADLERAEALVCANALRGEVAVSLLSE